MVLLAPIWTPITTKCTNGGVLYGSADGPQTAAVAGTSLL
jgi:hypothetical protein